MAKKYYAIKKGYDSNKNLEVRNLVVDSWNECLSYVKGVKGAIYKSFESLSEVEKYLSEENRILKKGIDVYPEHIPHAYVDGTFNTSTGKYGYGLVIVHNNLIIHLENGVAEDDSERALRQIPGELKAAIKAMEYAISNRLNHIVIFHDYEGICHHATGAWERKEKSSQLYYEMYNNFNKKNNLNITFVKVDSHTNDIYNEIADELAKVAAGLEINGVVEKILKTTPIKVENNFLREKLKVIISSNSGYKIEIVTPNGENRFISNFEESLEKMLNFKCEADLRKYLQLLNKEQLENLALELFKKFHNTL